MQTTGVILPEVDGEHASVWGDLENFFSKVKILVLYEVDILGRGSGPDVVREQRGCRVVRVLALDRLGDAHGS
jgi:hypothetical protein